MSDGNKLSRKDQLVQAQTSIIAKKNKRKASFLNMLSDWFDANDDDDNVALASLAKGFGKIKVPTEREYMAQLHATLTSKMNMKEIVGFNHNPEIVAMFAACGHSWVKDDETPWCAAFIGWGIKVTSQRLRVDVDSTMALNARSYLKWGLSVALHEVAKGDIVIIPRGNSNWQGHVFVFDHWEGDIMVGLGGNQRNAVNLRRYDPDRTRILGIRRVVLD